MSDDMEDLRKLIEKAKPCIEELREGSWIPSYAANELEDLIDEIEQKYKQGG